MSYGWTFTDREYFITTEPLTMFARELLLDIDEYFRFRKLGSPRNIIQHEAVYDLDGTYYPIFDKSLLDNQAYYDEDCQFIDAKVRSDVLPRITTYRVIDLSRKITVIRLDKVEGARDLFVCSTLSENKRWSTKELSSLYWIINRIRETV